MFLIPETRLKNALDDRITASRLYSLLTDIDVQEEPVEVFSFAGDFWDEEGYDSDGYWHEDDTHAGKDVVVEKAGIYYVLLDIYSQKPRKPKSTVVTLRKTSSARYYVIAMILLFVLFAISRTKSRTYNELPFNIRTD